MIECSNAYIVQRCFQRIHAQYGALADGIIGLLVDELGGLQFTFPTRKRLQREQRNRQIIRLLNGRNYTEIALRFAITPGQVRRIERSQK